MIYASKIQVPTSEFTPVAIRMASGSFYLRRVRRPLFGDHRVAHSIASLCGYLCFDIFDAIWADRSELFMDRGCA